MSGRLGAFTLLAGVTQAIYVCDRTQATIATISICNRTNTNTNIRIAISTSATAPDAADWIEYDVELLPKGVLERTSVMVNPNQYIVVRSSVAEVTAVAWGITQGDEALVPPTPVSTTPTWISDTALGSVISAESGQVVVEAHSPTSTPITYSLVSGTLPTSLTLNTSTGLISGNVTSSSYTAGGVTSTFTIGATDGTTPITKSFNIVKRWRDGSVAASAASSAADIKSLTSTLISGYYWINLNNTPTQVYCDMTGATAWMLAMRTAITPIVGLPGAPSGSIPSSVLGYSSAFWTNTNSLNPTGDPLTNLDIKNGMLWAHWRVNNLRLTASTTATAYTANSVGAFTGFTSNTLAGIFNSGNNVYANSIAYSRAQWITWANSTMSTGATAWDNQPNCNLVAINSFGNGSGARIGISMNNEVDCNSCDSSIGFGAYRSGLQELGCGAHRWNGDQSWSAHGWIWIN